MPRTWLSIPLGHGIRIGRSISDAELRGHLPNWRRFELRHGLQEAAKARGQPMTRELADYTIDRALATGLLDSSGGLNFTGKGFTAEEIAAQIMELSTAWGMPRTHEEALSMAVEGIEKARHNSPFVSIATAVMAAFIILIIFLLA